MLFCLRITSVSGMQSLRCISFGVECVAVSPDIQLFVFDVSVGPLEIFVFLLDVISPVDSV